MKNHSRFYRGFIFGVALIGIIDLTFVHLIFKQHRIYSHYSVNFIEPTLVIIAMIVGYILYKKEFRKNS
jgi:hypothetical protein